MKSVCKSLVLSLLLGIATLIPGQVRAQSPPEPSVVISIANLDEQLKDVKYLLTASGFPEFNFLAKAAIKGYAEGVDFSRNAGVALYFEGDNTTPGIAGFIPVDDIETLLDVISDVADVEENGDKKYTIAAPDGTTLEVKERGGYALFGTRLDLLDQLPTEPEKMIGKNGTKYNLAFNIFPQNVPKELKDQALQTIKDGSEQTLQEMDGELKEFQQENLKAQMRQFEMLLNDSESILIGMSADADNKKLFTDVEFVAKAGSELAKKANESKATQPSRYSGFLVPDAAMNFNATGNIPEADGQSYATLLSEGKKKLIEQLNEEGELSDAEFEKIEVLIESVIDNMSETLKEGVVDTGAAVVLDDANANLAGGFTVADPAKVETAVKDLIPLLKKRLANLDDPNAPEVTFNMDKETVDGIRFHQIQVSIDQPKARDLLGDSIDVIVGFGKDSILFGAGTGPLPMIKELKSAKQETEFASEMNFHIAQFLKFASRTPDAPPEVAQWAEQLSENGGDRVRIYGKHIENGSFTRFEMEDGILSLIKLGWEAQQQRLGNDF